MKRLYPLCALLCATLPAFAFVDSNNNGLSDLWERTYNNGQLYGSSFDPQADADGDGWTNAQEAAAGTNPLDPNPPEGIVRPQLTNIPAVWSEPDENGDSVIVTPASMLIAWPTTPGKQYTLLYSADLIEWLAVPNETFIGSGSVVEYGIELSNDDKLFWRVKIGDVDSDGNGLTDAEEQVLGIATGFTDANNNGIPDVWETQNSGSFAVYPPYLAACLSQNQTAQQSILLRNDTGAAVNYTVALSGTTGPAYSFGDSVTGNVEYTWEDVSATGTLLADISDADDAFEAVAISGFTFPFYGQNFSQVFVSSNGLLTFGTGSDAHYNTTLPSISAPANLIAPLWDDLDTRGTGDIYYKQESDRLIIQYQNVGRYGGTSTYTFQVVLFSDGRMQFRYHTLSDVADSCTVGIQNPMQTIGVQIVSSASYLASQMAIEIRPYSEFFTIDPASGVVPANSVSTLTGLFRSLAIPPAVYYANLSLSHDGAGSSPCEIPIRFAIRNLPSTVALTSPANSLVILEGQSISLHANASDPEGLARVEFLDGTTSIGEVVGNSNNCSLVYATPPVGTRYLIARAIDAYGAATNSAVIQVVVRADTDRDGMPDDWEIANGFNPVDAADASTDADGDGYTNIEEFQFGKDPHLVEDGDSDGMPDGWEYHNGLNLASDDASGDFDQDSLTNLQEYQAGTKANKADTDGDLIPDGWEVANGLNPLDPSDELLDNDTGGPDGLCNLDEYRYNTDPHNRDTDGDGVLDGQEANGPDGNPATDDGSDPTDPTDNGVRLPAVQLVTFNLGVGDRSGSASEDYVLNVFRLSPSDGSEQRIFTLRSGGFGQYTTQTKSFKKGETYTFQIQWIGTSRTLGPDWDCHLVVAPQGTSTGGILLDSYDPATKQLNNSNKILDPQDINPGDDDDDDIVDFPYTIQPKRVVFLSAELVPDWDRDGKIDANDRGQAAPTSPWRFWNNDDRDTGDTGGSDIPNESQQDYTATSIPGRRDLIDYFPLHLEIHGMLKLFPKETYSYWLAYDPVHFISPPSYQGFRSPILKVAWNPEASAESDGTTLKSGDWQKNLDKATTLITKELSLVNPYAISGTETAIPIPNDMLQSAEAGNGLIWLDAGLTELASSAPLELKVRDASNHVVASCSLSLAITGIEDMFRSIYVLPEAADLTQESIPSDPPNWPDAGRSSKHFVFVHGYNVSGTQARGWSSEMFKRMFWSGSNARFSAFVWRGNQSQVGSLTPNYQINLENAFNTAKSFKQFLDLIPGEKTVAAHSMGNVLVGAAMTDWSARPANYYMLDSAAAKECYDPAEADDAVQDFRMVHPAWTDYPKQLRASEFHRLNPPTAWPDSDWRGKLTWKGRFEGVMGNETKVYNFYSSGEEVLNNAEINNPTINPAYPFNTTALTWTSVNKMWAMQEKLKGHGLSGLIFTSTYGGWLPNLLPYISEIHTPDGVLHRMKTPSELPQPLTSAFLASRATVPFFDDTTHPTIYDAQIGSGSPGSNYVYDHRHKLIAEMIPCTTFAAGRNAFLNLLHEDPNIAGSEERNIDMNATMKTDPALWPISDANGNNGEGLDARPWLHSDIRDKAFVHNWKAFAKFVELGALNQNN